MTALAEDPRGDEMSEIGLLKAAGTIVTRRRELTDEVIVALACARDFDALIVHHTEDPNIVEGVIDEGECRASFGWWGCSRHRNHHARQHALVA